MWLRVKVRDDRGRVLPLVSAFLGRSRRGGMPWRERHKIESAGSPPAALRRRLFVRVVLAAVPVVALQAVLLPMVSLWMLSGGPWWRFLMLPLTAAGGVVMPLVLLRVLRGGSAVYVAAAYAKAGYCGSCCYQLGGRVEGDGCMVCSECGGAWRVGA